MLNEIPSDSQVKLVESVVNQNKYCVAYHGQKFMMSGHDLCKDLKLLESLSMQEAFKIIHETAYFSAQQDRVVMAKIEREAEDAKLSYGNV